ncbi:hypothetical protein PSTG_20205, partial [Puccinia striiformis f. sp. tritici PST-78]
AANGNDTVPSQTPPPHPATPTLTQPPVQQKVNSIRKTRVTRAAAKAPNPSQEVDPATEGTDEIGSTPVQEPSVLESSGEMATTLGAAHSKHRPKPNERSTNREAHQELIHIL